MCKLRPTLDHRYRCPGDSEARDGIPTGLIGIPLRYMHTPSEVIDLNDLEAVVCLMVAFAKSLKRGEKF